MSASKHEFQKKKVFYFFTLYLKCTAITITILTSYCIIELKFTSRIDEK